MENGLGEFEGLGCGWRLALRFLTRLRCFAWIMVVLVFSRGAMGMDRFVENAPSAGAFAVVQNKTAATIYVDPEDWEGVSRAAGDLQADIQRVTGVKPVLTQDDSKLSGNVIIIGTHGRSRTVEQIGHAGKVDLTPLVGKWESYLIQVVPDPMPGVANALVIAGSDKRGSIYGIYEVSGQMGVSPWYWWGDVPTPHKDVVFIKAGQYAHGEPSVKYRGIFFNDESPDLTNWVRAKFGSVSQAVNPKVAAQNPPANYGHEFYTKVFELLLRLHGNYMWPAMWNNAFNEDDPENAKLADMYGIVMGTSHQEPMLRAQKEWDWGPGRQAGNWNYNNVQQRPILENFWREGARRNKDFESIYTMGLRAENDSGQPIGAALTEQIVGVQRKILADEVNADVTKVPQMWCLYKEVQGFYEEGLRVPDDITLLWADDNWGNVRRLPTEEERKRPGGAGIYYHFDYHGGPRSYQWINTSPISKIWEQMSLAKQYGADRIWIVNVGHFKGYELPTEFFLEMGWEADRWRGNSLNEYTRQWAERQFGAEHATEIADIISTYTKYNARRKPELLDASTYSVVDYGEADRVASDYKALAEKAKGIYDKLPAEYKDAFYELVYFPTLASSQVNEMYVSAAKNALYAQQGRASANDFATQTQNLFKADADLMTYFNKTFAGGKWDHFMDQSHIGYTTWQDPPQNNMNAIRLSQVTPAEAASMAIALEGWAAAWPANTDAAAPIAPAAAGGRGGFGGRGGSPGRGPGGSGAAPVPATSPAEPALPMFDAFNRQKRTIDIFNRGQRAFDFAASASEPWIILSSTAGKVEKDERLVVSIDWAKAPKGQAGGTVTIKGPGDAAQSVKVEAFNPTEVTRDTLSGFVESEKFVSIEAEHYTRNFSLFGDGPHWAGIDDYGRTLSGMTIDPGNSVSATPPASGVTAAAVACLEYKMYVFTPGNVAVSAYLAPTLNFVPGRGLALRRFV